MQLCVSIAPTAKSVTLRDFHSTDERARYIVLEDMFLKDLTFFCLVIKWVDNKLDSSRKSIMVFQLHLANCLAYFSDFWCTIKALNYARDVRFVPVKKSERAPSDPATDWRALFYVPILHYTWNDYSTLGRACSPVPALTQIKSKYRYSGWWERTHPSPGHPPSRKSLTESIISVFAHASLTSLIMKKTCFLLIEVKSIVWPVQWEV